MPAKDASDGKMVMTDRPIEQFLAGMDDAKRKRCRSPRPLEQAADADEGVLREPAQKGFEHATSTGARQDGAGF